MQFSYIHHIDFMLLSVEYNIFIIAYHVNFPDFPQMNNRHAYGDVQWRTL